jgi:small-conductance mechanosensitive channel
VTTLIVGRRVRAAAAVCLLACLSVPSGLLAQAPTPPPGQGPTPQAASALDDRIVHRAPEADLAELSLANRPVFVFRAAIVPRSPRERADGALKRLTALVDENVTGPVSARELLGAAVITVAGRDAFAIVPDDVDEGAEDLRALTAVTIARLETALAEAHESRTPQRLVTAALHALAATVLLALALLAVHRLHRLLTHRAFRVAEAQLARTRVGADGQIVRSTWLLDVVRRVARFLALLTAGFLIYAWLAYTLQQFPVTRPWGEALGGYLVATAKRLAWGAVLSLPGLFTASIIFLCARFVVRLATLLFDAIAQGRLQVAALSGPRALPTRRLVTTLVWLFAVVVAYPYLPGSNTEAFKGVSVFVGLVVSLGSSGIVNQLMSGFMLTYSDALAPGEYVRAGDIEGTVRSLGVLSTKIVTPRNEEVTIPNAVMIGGTTTNYSRRAAEGVMAPAMVTIGYDTPWRQVEALLLLAATRTAGLRPDPPPRVMQTALSDFYAEYTLLVCVDDPTRRVAVLSHLHAAIQDAFNEHGVQIMSPHYESDTAAAKLVPPAQWFASPARRPDAGDAGSGG